MRKLVRDNIPVLMDKKNKEYPIITVTQEEQIVYLKQKLVEEAKEVFKAKTKEETMEELADVLEVIDAICNFIPIDSELVLEAKANKKAERGGFSKGIIIDFDEGELKQ